MISGEPNMVVYNSQARELTAKIVFYGPGLSGKTTNLEILHEKMDRSKVGQLVQLSAKTDRTIYFDLLPVELGNIKGYKIRFQLATVPGQIAHNETRKVVLKGVDGIVFVVDSQWTMLPKNLESFQNLKDNLKANAIPFEGLPLVVQYNKRDLPDILSVEGLQEALGLSSYPFTEAVASQGTGVGETFKLISKLTFVDLLRRLQKKDLSSVAAEAHPPSITLTPAPLPREEIEDISWPKLPQTPGEARTPGPPASIMTPVPMPLPGTLSMPPMPLMTPIPTPIPFPSPARTRPEEGPFDMQTAPGPEPLEEEDLPVAVDEDAEVATPIPDVTHPTPPQPSPDAVLEAAPAATSGEIDERLQRELAPIRHRLLQFDDLANRVRELADRLTLLEQTLRQTSQHLEDETGRLRAAVDERGPEQSGVFERLDTIESRLESASDDLRDRIDTEVGNRESRVKPLAREIEQMHATLAELKDLHRLGEERDRRRLAEVDQLREVLASTLAQLAEQIRRAVEATSNR
jgi:mutual gliding-motility protein MglA